jgi:tRNA threonylcarbamoyladenosine biosynthesis protein TsaB
VARDGMALGAGHWRTEQSHMGELPGQVRDLLVRCGLGWTDLDGLAVSIGPGSFTGLRIAVAFAKGLGFAGNLPVAAVSTLEALALAADAPVGTRVCAALDARKHEVYAALFEVVVPGAVSRLTSDAVWQPTAIAAACHAATVVVGDAAAAYAEAFHGACVRPFATHHPRGDFVARLGGARLAAGEHVALAGLEPAYVRAPDAKLPANPLR